MASNDEEEVIWSNTVHVLSGEAASSLEDEERLFQQESSTSKSLKRPDEAVKKQVASLMCQNSKRLTFLPKSVDTTLKTTSKVWSRFKEALIDNQRVGIFKCDNCPALFIYTSQTGNSNMNRHDCINAKKSVQTTKTKCLQPITKFVKITVPKESVTKLNREITIGLAKDLQPLSRIEGEGFRHIAQALIDFGGKYGSQPVSSVLQNRTTLKRYHLPDICATLKQDIKSSLATNAPSYPKLAFSKDLWTEKHQSNDFLSLSVHYIDKDWKLQKAMLGMNQFDKRKTTDNVRSGCENILGDYFDESQIDSIIENSFSVTDGGSNMIKLFPNQRPCECHKINLCGHWTFNEKPIPTAADIAKKEAKGKSVKPKRLFNLTKNCPLIKSSINGVKDLAKYFKQTKLNSQLSVTLKQEVCTRFNSIFFPLQSYLKSANEVKAILLQKQNIDKIVGIDDDVIESIVDFIKPFKECSDELSGDTYPTIQLVALWYHELRNHISINESDSLELKMLKKQAELCFEEYCVTDDFLYVACMLDPRYKSLKFVCQENKETAIDLLKAYMDKEKSTAAINNNLVDAPIPTNKTGSLPSKFEEYLDDCEAGTMDTQLELDRYLIFRLPQDMHNDSKLMENFKSKDC